MNPFPRYVVGQKVALNQWAYPEWTVELVQGDQLVIKHKDGAKQIIDSSKVYSNVQVGSDGWYVVANKPGFAYYIHWDNTTGGPVYQWGLNFQNSKIEAFPQPFGLNHQLKPFDWADYRPVKLTTEALR